MTSSRSLIFLLYVLTVVGLMEGCKPKQEINHLLELRPVARREAIERVRKYHEIYGLQNRLLPSMQTGSNVTIPRFFMIDARAYKGILQDSTIDTIFASLGAIVDLESDPFSSTTESDLIFHHQRPAPDGTIVDTTATFYDGGVACPIDCDNMGPDMTVYGKIIGPDSARRRIDLYNDVYGRAATARRWLFSDHVGDSILIPRYYSISRRDLQEVISDLGTGTCYTFYISIGVSSNAATATNRKYYCDLIFHRNRPDSIGGLREPEQDIFYSITRPYPHACGDG